MPSSAILLMPCPPLLLMKMKPSESTAQLEGCCNAGWVVFTDAMMDCCTLALLNFTTRPLPESTTNTLENESRQTPVGEVSAVPVVEYCWRIAPLVPDCTLTTLLPEC